MAIDGDPNVALLPEGEQSTQKNARRATNMANPCLNQADQEHKVPIQKTWTYPLLQGLAHLSSLLIAIAILTLCSTEVYFRDLSRPHNNSILNAFQFVAKLHEFIVGASLTGIVLYNLRYFLCTDEGLSFGYVTSALQTGSPQLLFSQEFWAPLTTHTRVKRQYWFVGLLVLAIALVGLIGPSSAILIIPQLDWWSLKDGFSGTDGFSWVNTSYENIWPIKVNQSLVKAQCDPLAQETDRACPFINMVDIQNWVSDWKTHWSPPNITVTADAGMLNYLTSSDGDEWAKGYSVASTGMSFLSRCLGTVWLYGQSASFDYAQAGRPMILLRSKDPDRPLLKPLVQTQCNPPQDISTADEISVTFNTGSLGFKDGESSVNTTRAVNVTNYRSANDTVQFDWVDLSADSGNVTLGALFGASFSNPRGLFPSFEGSEARALIACTIKSYWVPTTMSRDAKTDNVVILDNPNPYDIVKNQTSLNKARHLDIDLSFAEKLNAFIIDNGFRLYNSVFESELSRIAPNNQRRFDGTANETWQWIVSTVISMQLTDALSRISHQRTIFTWHQAVPNGPQFKFHTQNQTSDKQHNISYAQNLSDLKNLSNSFHPPGPASNYLDQIKANSPTHVPVHWEFHRLGYGWGFNKTTKALASAVLAAHAALVLVHFGIVYGRRWRFNSWKGPAEFLALALLSPPPGPLEGMSTRVKERVYAEKMYIRESEDGGSAVLCMDDGDGDDEGEGKGGGGGTREKIAVGKKYD